MPDYRRATCKECGKHRDRVGPISWRGNCRKCAILRSDRNIDGMRDVNSPEFAYYRSRLLAAFGVGILDDARPRGQTRD